MPTLLDPGRHLDGLRQAMLAFLRYAGRAGLEAQVPTCSEWTVRDLIAHQGMVHRWATALVDGRTAAQANSETGPNEREGLGHPDPLDWLADGAVDLARALATSQRATRELVFLYDAPRDPVAFWARRQCHETTLHAVDAMSASLGRPAGVEGTWITSAIAADGIDELLGGFLARPISKLRLEQPGTLLVSPDDRDEWWLVEMSDEPPRTQRHGGPAPSADWVLTGSAAELYLRLWNRTETFVSISDTLDWRAATAVRWHRR